MNKGPGEETSESPTEVTGAPGRLNWEARGLGRTKGREGRRGGCER